MIRQKTYDYACDWIILLDSDRITAQDRAEFVRWLNREPGNAIAYEEMSQLWARIDTLGPTPEDNSIFMPHVAEKLRLKNSSRNFARWITACLVVIALMSFSIIVTEPSRQAALNQQFVTAMNQQHRVVAPDGSIIELGPLSSIAVNYSPSKRGIRLDRGHATFTVAPDVSRPFIVGIAETTVLAMGTKFSVHADSGRIEVSVLEGSISFRSDNSGAGESASTAAISTLILTADQSLIYRLESKTIELDS